VSDEQKYLIAGVIGSPIAHSKSPAIHGHWIKKYGIKGHYVPLDIAQKDFAEALRLLPRMGFVGVNVTIPHKLTALSLADHVTDRAALIGAANTLTFRSDGSIYADNTDGHGFLENIRTKFPEWRATDGPAVVFGAGGAARAAVSALIEAGAPEVRITNRTRSRAEALRTEFGGRVIAADWVQAGNMLEGAATVVNCSALGMTGKPDLKVPLDALERDALVTDMVYSPLNTRLLSEAAERGCRTVDGLGMLLHQAVPGFERWFGAKPVVDEEIRQLVLNL
jgi:shikimate dehydrogenase